MWVWLAGKWFWWIVSTGLLDRVTRSWSQNTFPKRPGWSPPIDWASMLHVQEDKNERKYQETVYGAKQSNSRLQNALAVTVTCAFRVQELLQSGTLLGCLSMGARPGGGDGVLCVYPCTPGSRMLLSVAWVAGWSNSWDEKPGKKGLKVYFRITISNIQPLFTAKIHLEKPIPRRTSLDCSAIQTQQEHAHSTHSLYEGPLVLRGLHTVRWQRHVLQQWHL